MYSLHPSKQYRKAFKRLNRSGRFDASELENVLALLVMGNTLPVRYANHTLQGKYSDCFECHIKSDMLLIYKIDSEQQKIALVRLGSHSELFG